MMDKSEILVKIAIAFLAIICIWNLTKMPYYLGYGHDGNTSYESHGIELSINLGHWVPGYRSHQMRTPPCNFLLVHTALGITLVVMMILTLVKKSWRKKYCVPFFWFSIFEGIHAVPASLINDAGFMPLFMVACTLLIGSGIYGLITNSKYAEDPEKAEKTIFILYVIITVVNSFAGILEAPNIVSAFSYKADHGEFLSYGDEPKPIFGHTIYDKFPENIGLTVFLAFTFGAWFVWPLLLVNLDIEPAKKGRGLYAVGPAGENTSLIA